MYHSCNFTHLSVRDLNINSPQHRPPCFVVVERPAAAWALSASTRRWATDAMTWWLNYVEVWICGGFHKWGYPPNGWFTMEKGTKIWMIWGYPHFRKPPYMADRRY